MTAIARLTVLGLLLAAPASAETVKLTLLGVGDVYNFEEEDGRGGFARLNAVAKAERAANPNTLYLFNGDMLSPSLASGFDQGQNTIDFTNLVPFDLAVPATMNSTSGRRISSRR
jgi:5'-nucleotidase / UDP-sugar diphosphatase